ncbi:hypothetical protein [Vibrio crassostreae]|uniref:hypothetical protein n=1 Tax=Vibrio crassostreae TaxID=246167 RepID=UPI00062EFD8E|nr:hypothetical protein [Vibrio crassostreae]CDT76874.1 hypothetical protein VCRLGP8_990070 [Vibrio crassostreae]
MGTFKKAAHAVKETGEVMGGWVVSFYYYVFGKPNGKSNNANHANEAGQKEQNRTLGLGEAGYQQQVINNTTSAQFRNHNGGY